MTAQSTSQKKIKYPYIHPKGRIVYVPADDAYMLAAKKIARDQSLDKTMPGGVVLVKDGKIIGSGANGSDYHDKYGCERVRLNIPTGEGYELCEGCHPKNHAEPKAIADAKKSGYDTHGSEAYLWGHWWACEDCWKALTTAGITTLYLMENSQVLFNKLSPKNIVGKQFA